MTSDFQKARLQLLQARSRVAESQFRGVIAGFENLNSDEDVGPGVGVLYTWLGEAQFQTKKYDQALNSYTKAADSLEKDVQFDNGRCGIATDCIRKGDTYLRMNRLSDAESAYRGALAKSNLAVARDHEDLPALYPIAGAYASLGNLQLAMAEKSASSEERARIRNEACAAFTRSLEIQKQIPIRVTMSPSDFPVTPFTMAADASTMCRGITP